MLNESDRRRLLHGKLIDTRACALLQPQGESRLAPSSAAVDAAEVEPCTIVSERLARTTHETRGGGVHTAGLPLL